MTTGTINDDNLSNDPNVTHETVDALAGNDVLTIVNPIPPFPGPWTSFITADGGDGSDTLRITSGSIGSLSASGYDGFVRVKTRTDVYYELTWTSFERVEISGNVDTQNPTFTTGDSIDKLTLSGVFNTTYSISTGGGDDEVHFSSNGSNYGGTVILDGGTGNDILDVSGIVRPFGVSITQTLSGGEGNDVITGSNYADTLNGNAGDDYLDGGLGSDQMTGGTGNDIYIVAVTDPELEADTVIEAAGEGTDEVRTALATYILAANVENLTGTRATGQSLTGNDLDNVITGGAGNDTIDGGVGNDVLNLGNGGADHAIGNVGNDYFFFGGAFDASDVVEGGVGTDTVALLGTYNLTLGANTLSGVETLSLLSGTAAGGSAHVTYSITTVDQNVPAGGTLTVYAGGLLSDESLLFDAHAETDGALSVYGGAGNDVIAGGPAADAFVGGAGDDQLYGLGGNDWLEGGLGADMLRGGFGSDLFVYKSAAESTAAASDHIVDFEDQVDLINLQAVDADSNTAGDQAFTFIGQNAFSGAAGELRIEGSGSTWFVQGDTDGDGLADLVIQVDTFRGYALQATNFML